MIGVGVPFSYPRQDLIVFPSQIFGTLLSYEVGLYATSFPSSQLKESLSEGD